MRWIAVSVANAGQAYPMQSRHSQMTFMCSSRFSDRNPSRLQRLQNITNIATRNRNRKFHGGASGSPVPPSRTCCTSGDSLFTAEAILSTVCSCRQAAKWACTPGRWRPRHISRPHAHLLKQRQIVFDVPVVGDAAVLDLEEIGRNEGNRLSLALRLAEGASEMAVETHVYGDVIASDDHLLHRHLEIRHGSPEPLRGKCRPLRPLRTPRRQGTVGEAFRDCLLQQGDIPCVPELIEGAHGFQGRGTLSRRDVTGDDEFLDLNAVGGEGRYGQRKSRSYEKPQARRCVDHGR